MAIQNHQCTSRPCPSNIFPLNNSQGYYLTRSAVASGKLKVCTTQPMQVCYNVTFLVDLHSLDDPVDIRADENGAWNRKGSPVAYVSIHNNGGTTAIYERNHMGSHFHHYKIIRAYRHSSHDFTKIITTVSYSPPPPTCVCVYVCACIHTTQKDTDLRSNGNRDTTCMIWSQKVYKFYDIKGH